MLYLLFLKEEIFNIGIPPNVQFIICMTVSLSKTLPPAYEVLSIKHYLLCLSILSSTTNLSRNIYLLYYNVLKC